MKTFKQFVTEAEKKTPLIMKNVSATFEINDWGNVILKGKGIELKTKPLSTVNMNFRDADAHKGYLAGYTRRADGGDFKYDGVDYKVKQFEIPGGSAGGRYYGRELRISTKDFYFTLTGDFKKLEDLFDSSVAEARNKKIKIEIDFVEFSKN